MADSRQWLAVGLGVLFGLGLVLAPRAAIRLSVVTQSGQRRHRGEYGSDSPIPESWVWATRALGVCCLGVAAVIAL